MIWCTNQGPDFGYTNDPLGATYKLSLPISSRKNGYPCKRNVMIGPPARGARHDIILPGHQRTNIITLGMLSQPSYLTEIQIRLVSWYLRLRMSEKKRCDTYRRNDIARFSGNWTMGAGSWNNSSSLNQVEDEEVADGLSDNSTRIPNGWISTLMWTRRWHLLIQMI